MQLYGRYDHQHVTERETDGTWEDCRWAACIEYVRAVGQEVPANRTEYEALRAESGDLVGGTDMADQVKAMQARYGWIGDVRPNTEVLVTPVGWALTLDGSMGAFPAGHRLRRWDPGFTGGHSVAVFRLETGWWWCDPLAPLHYGPKPMKTYTGEFVGPDELIQFARSFPGGSLMRSAIDSRRAKEDEDLDLLKLEDWRARSVAVLRDRPDRTGGTIVFHYAGGELVRSIGEKTTPDGNRWRLTEYAGKPAWMLRSDFEPLDPGGDPALDAILHDLIERRDTRYAKGWSDARTAAVTAVGSLPQKP